MNDNVFGMSTDDDSAETPSSPTDVQTSPAPEAVAPAPQTPTAPDPEPVVAPEPETAAAPQEEAADEDDEATYLATDGQGIRLGNKVYKDWQGADHVFRQFAGRAKAAAQREKEALERARKAEELLEASIRNRAQEPAAAPVTPDPAPAPKRIADSLPSEDDIDAMIAEHGPAQAILRVAQMMAETVVPRVVDEQTGDVQRMAKVNRAVETADQLFSQVEAAGTFPELVADDPSGQAIVDIWYDQVASNPKLAHLALTEDGVQIAVEKYRAGLYSQPQSAAPEPSAPVARLVAQVKAQASARQALTSMSDRGGARPQPGPTRVSGLDLEEAARRAVAGRRHEVFGMETE
jgi:hypothetical protein